MRGLFLPLIGTLCGALSAQTIFTAAGLPYSHRGAIDSQPALAAPLQNVYGLLIDKQTGRLLFHDETLVSRLEPDGTITAVVGMGRGSDGSTANGTLASGLNIEILRGMAQDATGALYVSEAFGRVYRIGLDGVVTTFAGGGPAVSSNPTPANLTPLGSPRGLTFDSKGNLDIAATFCTCILQVTPSGAISTLFTLPQQPGFFQYFEGVAIDSHDNLYATSYRGNQIWKIASNGSGTLLAGTGAAGFSGDGGPALSAQLNGPTGIALDNAGNIVFTDTLNSRIRKIAPDGTISTVAGTAASGFSGDGGPASSAQLSWPAQIVFDAAGDLYIADYLNRRVRMIAPDGTISTIAGSGLADYPAYDPAAGDGGPTLYASFNAPSSIVFDPAGDLYIADMYNNRVRRIAPNGIVSTFAGSAQASYQYTGDGGPATQATIIRPITLALDSAGAVYFCTGDSRVLKVTPDGIIHAVAGSGTGTGLNRSGGDGGPATSATLNEPKGLAIDAKGNVYIGDTSNARLRKVDTNGIVTTVAGPGIQGTDYWNAVASDPQGNLYVAITRSDVINQLFYSEVDRVNADGSLTRVAGNRRSCNGISQTFAYEGAQAIATALCVIVGMTIDAQGVMYIPESFYGVVLRVGLDGTVTRIAGSAASNSLGDGGSPLNANLQGGSSYYSPPGVAFDAAGNMFLPQAGANRIREVMSGPLTTRFSQARVDFTATAARSQTVQVLTNIAEPLPFAVLISSDAPWLTANRATALTGDSLTLSANVSGLSSGVHSGTVSVTVPGTTAVAALPVSITIP